MRPLHNARHPDQGYKPSARIIVIPLLHLEKPIFVSNKNVIDYAFASSNTTPIVNFPVILCSDGTPWEIGNKYLINIAKQFRAQPLSNKTIRGTADDLLNYLRFLEEYRLDPLYLPKNERLRVTYRYLSYVQELVIAGSIRFSTGKQRINRMVNFYKGLIEQGIISKKDIPYSPFEEFETTIKTLDGKGFTKLTTIHKHNLKLNCSKEIKDPELIIDDGSLKPLTLEDQTTLLEALKFSNNRQMQLIFYLALFTGARIQTCCTIKVKHIYGKLDSNSDLRLRIGAGTGIDNKNGKNMTIVIPNWLVNDLKIYTSSPIAKKFQKKSRLGESDENYAFLTNRGQPYYTSKAEIRDYQKESLTRKAQMDKALKIQEGTTIRVFLAELLKKITLNKPDFINYSFHDLRATFGMNLLEKLMSNPMHTVHSALTVVQQRMGHTDLEVTMRYLNYRSNIRIYTETQDTYEKALLEHVQHHDLK
ncbi:tyrosine-type recombinase/integrase [Pseudomonas mosselii]|uniref:tyrosine-type recombinase/integrase n=1 Tax=Pseudomonas mosselii TaxID=78327 RepID=UPI0027DBFCD5|nr:site-specific integrase [Pseudomonas mosselii]